MQPTRRVVLTGTGAVMLAPSLAPFLPRGAFADGAVIGWHDRTLDDYTKLHDTAINDGYRLVSLSLYGPTAAPNYAAVLIKRTAPAEQRHWPLLTGAQLTQTLADQAAQNFGATLIAATGPASDPRFALACERQDKLSLVLRGLRRGRADDPASLDAKHRDA